MFNHYRIVESFEQMGANLIQNDDFVDATSVSTSLAFRGEKMPIKTLQTTGRAFSVAMDENGEKNLLYTYASILSLICSVIFVL